MREAERVLREFFGLNLYEARAYLILIRGAASPGEIADKAQIPKPRVYDVLRSLASKGFVEEVEDGYRAVNPRIALEGRLRQFEALFRQEQEAREKAFKHVVEVLERTYSKVSEYRNEAVILRGLNSIANRFEETVSRSMDIILCVKKAASAKHFFLPYVKRHKEKRFRILISSDVRLEDEDLQTFRALEIDIRSSDCVLLDLMVADDREVAIGVPDPYSEDNKEAVAIWIINPPFASSVRKTLEDAWIQAKKITY